jgi:hypothetical protein
MVFTGEAGAVSGWLSSFAAIIINHTIQSVAEY